VITSVTREDYSDSLQQ